jgi:hypothetical protein
LWCVITAVSEVTKQKQAVKAAQLTTAVVEYSNDAIIGSPLKASSRAGNGGGQDVRLPQRSRAVRLPPRKRAASVCVAVRVVLVADSSAATSRTPQKAPHVTHGFKAGGDQTMLRPPRGADAHCRV